MRHDSPLPPDDDLTGVNAEAIREARRRVEERNRVAQAERERIEAANRRAWWDFEVPLGSPSGLLFNALGSRLALAVVLVALWFVVSAVFWLAGALRTPFYLMVRSLDIVTGAQVLAIAPWVVWTLWGAIFGGALGYWLVAPLYGLRENRSLLLWLPLLAMIVIGAISWVFRH